jgi:hypothetical protein
MFSRMTQLFVVTTCLVLATSTLAAGPQLINYQGTLTNDQGQPLDGTYNLTFKVYATAAGGSALWTQTIGSVAVVDGLFNVILGGAGFPSGLFTAPDRWLGITVGGGAELTPRMRFTSVPWALRSTVADTALVAVSGGGSDGDWTIAGSNMYSAVAGNVGVGTTAPGKKLQVGNNTVANAEGMIRLGSRSGTNGSNRLWDIGVPETDAVSTGIGYSFIVDDTQNDTECEFMVKFDTGHVGIGTTTPTAPLQVVRPVDSTAASTVEFKTLFESLGITRYTTMAFEAGAIEVTGSLLAQPLVLNGTSNHPVQIAGGGGDVILAAGGGNVGIGTTSPAARLDVAGTARVQILEISGADLAEKFPVSEQSDPGTVVVIDPDRAGSLRPSGVAYDTRVAGVISGAGGLSVGAVLGQCTPERDAQPIAMSGRVWTRCDATACAIEPGDLLTTAGLPGHAMKAVDPTRAHGAVIGKAMTRLARGETGLVLVLINLQ